MSAWYPRLKPISFFLVLALFEPGMSAIIPIRISIYRSMKPVPWERLRSDPAALKQRVFSSDLIFAASFSARNQDSHPQ